MVVVAVFWLCTIVLSAQRNYLNWLSPCTTVLRLSSLWLPPFVFVLMPTTHQDDSVPQAAPPPPAASPLRLWQIHPRENPPAARSLPTPSWQQPHLAAASSTDQLAASSHQTVWHQPAGSYGVGLPLQAPPPPLPPPLSEQSSEDRSSHVHLPAATLFVDAVEPSPASTNVATDASSSSWADGRSSPPPPHRSFPPDPQTDNEYLLWLEHQSNEYLLWLIRACSYELQSRHVRRLARGFDGQ